MNKYKDAEWLLEKQREGLTQEQVAKRAGVKQNTISTWESRLGISREGTVLTKQTLARDLRQTACGLNNKSITASEYEALGSYNVDTIVNYFGTWNAGKCAAGLKIN